MSTTHKIDATIGVGDPDLGAEVEARITFTYYKAVDAVMYGTPQPGEPAHVEWVSAEHMVNSKPSPFSGSFADLEKSSFDATCEAWLESDEGQSQAIEQALDDLQRGRDD